MSTSCYSVCMNCSLSVWLYDICRGYEYEPVRPRQLSKSCGCGKNFTGTAKLVSREKVRYWMFQLASEISDRLKNEEAKVGHSN